mgnify:CR=1 FL=1
MGLLDRFEQRVDRAVNGAFAKAFKSELQPVEIAAALTNEMDSRAAVVSRARTVVPNVYTVIVSTEDYDRLSVYDETLVGEFAVMIRDYAQQQQYSFLGSVTVAMQPSEDSAQGTVEIISEARVDHEIDATKAPIATEAVTVTYLTDPEIVAAVLRADGDPTNVREALVAQAEQEAVLGTSMRRPPPPRLP